MKTSDAGVALIQEFEGMRLTAYLCPAKVWTIGYGHTSAAGAPTVTPGMNITRTKANEILKSDLDLFPKKVDFGPAPKRAVPIPGTPRPI